MSTFTDKPLFNLKQLGSAIGFAFLVGGGISRFEFKMGNIETKLDKITAIIDTNSRKTNAKFIEVDRRLLASENDIKAITTSLTALLKPEDVEIKERR